MRLLVLGSAALHRELEKLLQTCAVELVDPGAQADCVLMECPPGQEVSGETPVVLLVDPGVEDPGTAWLSRSGLTADSLLCCVRWAIDRHGLLRRLEQAARASDRAQEILAHVTHEMRSPMTVISMATQLASNPRLAPEKREKHLGLLADSTRVLQTLINDILDFSKLDAGRLELSRIDFRLRDLLEHITAGFRLLAAEKGVRLTLTVGPEVPDRLNGDPGRLRQVIANLVSNAVKFTEHGKVEEIVLCENLAEDAVTLHVSVRDTGMGISQEAQRRIFEPYVQADRNISRKFGGTGLGLAITWRLVEMMGGRIRVESQPGRGSAFRFTARLAVQRPSAEEVQEVSLAGQRILLADRNEASRERLRGRLGDWGMQVVDATGPGQTLERLETERFELLLMDLSTGGFPLLEELKKRGLLEDTAVVLTTAAGQRGDGARCVELGVSGYLTGGLSDGELRRALELCLGSSGSTRLVTRHSLRLG